LPSLIEVKPQRRELIDEIDLPTPDLSTYDRLFGIQTQEETDREPV